ncbi:PCYCGC motif-containing (lipo)protein [Paenibacillus sp. KN14-4R]|uniref:PCYCGC motif-containing (lipo)protein n=1 Tax=Paenibacillus sp. KN14-4R TaxID=3445773 RepID=UPI003FA15270
MRYKLFVFFILCVLVLSACSTKKEEAHQDHIQGDIQEKTASASVLPTFLNNQKDEIRMVYQVAGMASDIIKWIPCYCGCGESAGHTSNLNCFIKDVNADGSVVWDDHGTRCGVCLQIAVESVKMKQEGKTLKEIRTMIDQKYEKGYANPTKTPIPA